MPSVNEAVMNREAILLYSTANTEQAVSEKFSGLHAVKYHGGVLIIYERFRVEVWLYLH